MLSLILIGVGVGGVSYIFIKYKEYKKDLLKRNQVESQQNINSTAVLLEMSVEKDTEVDLGAIELMWKYFSSIAEIDDETNNPHVSFEIISQRDDLEKRDEVVFYLWVPRRFRDMFKSRLKAIYPSMIIEEKSNDYMDTIRETNTSAMANMGLSRHFLYPIKKFDSIKDSDPLQTLITSMSKVENKERCITQILLRPVGDDWKEEAKSKLKSFDLEGVLPEYTPESTLERMLFLLKATIKAIFTFAIDIFTKSGSDIVSKQSAIYDTDNSVDMSKVESEESKNILDKVMSSAYSVEIRIFVSSPLGKIRAEDKLDEICASFRELDGDNKIVKKPIGSKDNFMNAFKSRWYPIGRDNDILSTKEISVMCHYPNLSKTVTLKAITTKIVECAPGLSTENLLGYAYRNGMKVPVGIDKESRFRHVWIGGQTGTGKSTIMENMIINDIHNGEGLLFIDPHGESAAKVIELCDSSRKDIYYLNVSDITNPPSINMFEVFSSDHDSREHEKAQICESFIVIFKRIFGSGAIGPNTEDILRNAAYAVLENPDGASLMDIYLMLTSEDYRNMIIRFLDAKPALKIYWAETFAGMCSDPRFQQQNLNAPLNKLRRFINDPILANMVCPKKSTINIKQAMDTGAVMLINLSKGRLGELTANIIGSVLVSQIQIATMMRSGLPQFKMTPFFLYIDEFENFIGGEGGGAAFESILSEARKYRLGLIIANQYMAQLESGGGAGIKAAIFGNCGTTGVYRVTKLLQQI